MVPGPAPHKFRLSETLSGGFWTVAISLVAVYLFFLVLGAFSVGDALPTTLLVAGLAALYGTHALAEHRRRDEEARDPRLRAARERRGF